MKRIPFHGIHEDFTLTTHYLWFHELLPALILVAVAVLLLGSLCMAGKVIDLMVERSRAREIEESGISDEMVDAAVARYPRKYIAVWFDEVPWHLRVPEPEFSYFEKTAA